jgi:hypothetical protein
MFSPSRTSRERLFEAAPPHYSVFALEDLDEYASYIHIGAYENDLEYRWHLDS